ncbi:phospholipid-transporting ATPase 10 isoform X3 [Raphanus sativus]|uniref:P-type phospholipid transporter n=1 Tax=Raphanus sativus TaxID=3726 RepID=A0A9W3DGA4_RAPSA|nr:phospholipid-transporting ATPase 10 isoform X3 [Raphanus sativus]
MAGGGRRRRRLHLSRIYSYTCGKSSFQEDHSNIGGPGFSRVVYCNEPDSPAAERRNYAGNYVCSTKYTAASFFPKSLFEQFRRVANFYFLVTGILSLTDLSPYGSISALLPLALVITVTMVKDGIEDWHRKQQDIEVNNRKVKVHDGDGIFRRDEWRNIRVGDVVRVEKDEFFPADLLLLSSSYEDSICYVETMNLDGETNLKVKQGLDATSSLLNEDSDFKEFRGVVRCEDPNVNLYMFVGSLELGDERFPLSIQQILLRDSKLRNTEYVYGAVVFTGHDIQRVYKLLNVLEFNSSRKRMSVIVRDDDGRLLLLSKGADNVMFERLAKNGRQFEAKTQEHVNQYADAGLRTLILAYREVDENEYIEFNKGFNEAKSSVSEDREALIDEITDKMERDLILLGATAVEDKLQNGVPECIDKLAQAGIKIWVLTGDKMETAINIGFASSLLRQEMKQIIINLETPHIKSLEKSGVKDEIELGSRESVVKQIEEGRALLDASGASSEAFALIIDGKSLTYALEDEIKKTFLDLATGYKTG